MKLEFKKLIIHNFLSYNHSEIDLSNKGYCLVSGINNNPKDNAISNGSGKSSWSSAICWALTGNTIQGVHNNIKNINIDENLCYVTLQFLVDGDNYVITRYKEPKTDLKIIINNEDKSGKGIRESEAILSEYLPDLTNDLIASIIILGQGLPGKFSNNTASGRKEVLEKLSKSDFMIQDLKNKILKRELFLKDELRKVEDNILASTSKLSILNEQKIKLEEQLNDLNLPKNFDQTISKLTIDISKLETIISEQQTKIINHQTNTKTLSDELSKLLSDKNNQILKLNESYGIKKETYLLKKGELDNNLNINSNNFLSIYHSEVEKLNSDSNDDLNMFVSKINSLKTEISKLKSITDTCPTCGQKLQGITKPDTTEKESELTKLEKSYLEYKNNIIVRKNTIIESYNSNVNAVKKDYSDKLDLLEKDFNKDTLLFKNYLSEINNSFDNDITEIKYKLKQENEKIDLYTQNLKLKNQELLSLKNDLNKVTLDKENHTNKIKDTETMLNSIIKDVSILNINVEENAKIQANIQQKLAIISKINSLIKRDFRGFLLNNVISFINKKGKEYSKDIFGSDEFEFTLNGNNVDITYCNKAFENLSGGEKQKIDLIIQFAIRDMMSNYLDFSSNILVLDEIFDGLDAIGVTNLLNLISNKLNDIESIFIISHRASELEIPYDHEMIITKSNLGISTIKES